MSDYAPLDEALLRLAPFGIETRSGLTNHGPMVAEALCAVDRADAVLPWVDRYRSGLVPPGPVRSAIDSATDRAAALGRPERYLDWLAYFRNAIAVSSWQAVVQDVLPALLPGFLSDAVHGALRTGHALRALAAGQSAGREDELARALAHWSSTYFALSSGSNREATGGLSPGAAIKRVPLLPEHKSKNLVEACRLLKTHEPFAPVIDWIEVPEPPEQFVSELTHVFADVLTKHARDPLSTIALVHGVTGAAAVRSFLPFLSPNDQSRALRFAWQSGAALLCCFGSRPALRPGKSAGSANRAELLDQAIAGADEHAIKLTAVCVLEYELRPERLYLDCAARAISILAPPA